MRAIKLNLLVMTLGISVLGFSQKTGKEFFQREKMEKSTTSERNIAGWNDTKNVHKKWIGTKLKSIESYKPLETPKKQTKATAQSKQSNMHKAAKQQLDSVVYDWGWKEVYKYDGNGNCVVKINYYLDEEQNKYEYTYDAKGNQIMRIGYSYWDNKWTESYKWESAYDVAGNQTMYAHYSWYGTAWEGLQKDSSAYDANGNTLLEISYEWDNGAWVGDSKREYKYDADDNQTEEITSYWVSTNWVEAYKEGTIYNANGDWLFMYSCKWSGTAWDTTNKYEFTYDISGVLERVIMYEWDEYIADWIIEKAEITYNIDGNIETIIVSEWDASITDWEVSSKEEYTYNTDGNLEMILRQNWDGTSWKGSSRIEFGYDTDGNQNMFVYYIWDGTNWEGIWKDTSAYDAAGRQILKIIYLDWSGTGIGLNEYTKEEWAYDIYGNLILEASYDWNGTRWIGDEKEEWKYDANRNLLMEAQFGWLMGDWFGSKYEYEYDTTYAKTDLIFPSSYDNMYNKRLKGTFYWGTETNWTKDEDESETYYWGEQKVTIVETTNNVSIQVFPNPVSAQLHVNLNTQETVDYAIYNIVGQIIMQGKLQESSVINVESLSNGMYYLKVSGKENTTLKIIKN
jgi:hypothetical protein